jgi:hypothetical protein
MKGSREKERRVRVSINQLLDKRMYFHDTLPDNLVERIKILKGTLTEIFPQTLEEWIDGFRMDMHPEREISIWENMADKYVRLLKIHSRTTQEERREMFGSLLTESFETDPIVMSNGPIASA